MIAPAAAKTAIQNTFKISHAAETLRRYPGERVNLFTRAEVGPSLPGFRVQIILPPGLKFEAFRADHLPSAVDPLYSYDNGTLFLIWDIEKDPGVKACCDFQVTAVVAHTRVDQQLECTAALIAENEGKKIRDEETVTIAVKAKGAYLKYLPSIYQDDDLMGRLLMLFESFLAPLEQQINHMPDYLDARMTSAELMPWLASWTGMVLDGDLSEKQRRQLLWKAGMLYAHRGTRRQLQDYLEIITGGKVEVNDSPGFRLGLQTFLGLGIALGQGNRPYTFSVTVRMPFFAGDLDEEACERQKRVLERKVRTVIDTEKPAHTGYQLQIIYEESQAANG